MTPFSVLLNANKTLTILTKVRCVTNFPPGMNYKPKDLYTWPLPFETDKTVLSYIKTLGIELNNNLKIRALQVPHDKYRELSKLDIVDIKSLRWLRSCIDIHILSALPKEGTKIVAAWDKRSPLGFSAPQNTFDCDSIFSLASRHDGLYAFSNPSWDWKYKIRAYLGPIIFNDLDIFPQFKILHDDMSNIAGKTAGTDGRAPRYVVQEKDAHNLRKVIVSTAEAIQKVLPMATWMESVKTVIAEHH